MEPQQRFLRRKFLLENVDRFLRESIYHRTHDEEEDLPGVDVWYWDDSEGSNADPL